VTQMSDGEIDLPPDRQLRADMLAIRQKLTPNGFTISLPETADGRHADYAPSVSLALAACAHDPDVPQAAASEQEQEWQRLDAAAARHRRSTGYHLDEPPPWLGEHAG
jgi:hypothetical protein